jgi:transposase InsO family protein
MAAPVGPKKIHRWRYLATVTDLFSRRIVGWTLSRNRTIEITLRALKRALVARNPKPGLLFHSDRGTEYSAYGYQDFLKANGIVSSMNRPRHCQDNAHMESFFHSLRAELTHQRSYASDAELNASVARCIIASGTKNASIPAWGTIPRSSSSAWQMPSKVSTKADEDHARASAAIWTCRPARADGCRR